MCRAEFVLCSVVTVLLFNNTLTVFCACLLSGPAAAVCAETLRQEGFRGRIVAATKDKHLPYDRPKLCKVGDSLFRMM